MVNHFVGKEIYGFRIENRNQMFFSQLVTISKADCDDITQLTENCFDSDFDSENSGVFLLCTEEIRFPISNNFVPQKRKLGTKEGDKNYFTTSNAQNNVDGNGLFCISMRKTSLFRQQSVHLATLMLHKMPLGEKRRVVLKTHFLPFLCPMSEIA